MLKFICKYKTKICGAFVVTDGHVHVQNMRNLFPLSSFSPKCKSTLQVWSGPCRARQVLFNFHKFHSFSTNHCQRKPTNFFHLLCFSIIFFQCIAISFLNTGKYRISFFEPSIVLESCHVSKPSPTGSEISVTYTVEALMGCYQ